MLVLSLDEIKTAAPAKAGAAVFLWRWRELTCPAGQATSRLWSAPGAPFTTARVQLLSDKNMTPAKAEVIFLVEMAGVEPASESASEGTSPGADDYLHSLAEP